MLKWTLAELAKYRTTPLHFSETLALKADLIARDPEILDVTPITAEGYISFDDGDVLASVTLKGTMVVPSTRSLKPVDLPLDFTFSEVYLTDPAHEDKYEEGQLVLILEGDSVDIQAAIEDHILLAVPMQVLTPEEAEAGEMPHGTDWTVMGEEAYQKAQETDEKPNPAFAKLKDLFPDDEDKH
ncbi:YceD family protein [Lacticaseibacillus jixianensis]|uniref:YceD family protein n=1 Tax=Lacticaseibacillus jixianensis TaxID=2486012 RepID=A0ABW4BBE9_9LACO|nr:YceD family protein [Lacticaseibacillus jixianensis]